VGQCGPQVGLFDGQPPQCGALLRRLQLLGRVFGQGQVVRRVAAPGDGAGAVTGGVQANRRVGTDRFQQPVATGGAPDRGHEGLVDEPRQHGDHRRLVGVDRDDGCEVEVGRKDAEPVEQRAFVVVEMVVAPIDRGPQGAVPGRRGASPGRQQFEAPVQVGHELLRPERAHPRGGQFDRQR
jgi:hypothetical protein